MKRVLTFISGFLCCAVVMILINVLNVQGFAETKFLNASWASYPINVNGKETNIDALNYQGNTYLKIIDIDRYIDAIDVQWGGLETGENIIDQSSDINQKELELIPKDEDWKSKYYIDKVDEALKDYQESMRTI